VVPGRADEGEAAAVDRLARDPGGERGARPARLRRDRVRVEQLRPVDALEPLEVHLVVDAREVGAPGAPLDHGALEEQEPLGTLGMLAGRVQPGEVVVRQRLDVASRRPASAPRPSSDANAAARAQSGSASTTGGKGASGSSVAIER
jgi:hypothetical protein